MAITIAALLQQLLIFIPTIIASTTVITGAINGAFDIENANIKHIISWVVAILCGVLTVFTGGLAFGLGWVDYLIGAGFGLVAGGAANGLYDWPAISNIIDKFYDLFGHGETLRAKRAMKK